MLDSKTRPTFNTRPSVHLSTHPSVHLSVSPSIHPSVHPSTRPSLAGCSSCPTHQCRWGTCLPWCTSCRLLPGHSPPGTHSGSSPGCLRRCARTASHCSWRTHRYLGLNQMQRTLSLKDTTSDTRGLAPLLMSAKDTLPDLCRQSLGECGKLETPADQTRALPARSPW